MAAPRLSSSVHPTNTSNAATIYTYMKLQKNLHNHNLKVTWQWVWKVRSHTIQNALATAQLNHQGSEMCTYLPAERDQCKKKALQISKNLLVRINLIKTHNECSSLSSTNIVGSQEFESTKIAYSRLSAVLNILALSHVIAYYNPLSFLNSFVWGN